jgi:hypothetical protein
VAGKKATTKKVTPNKRSAGRKTRKLVRLTSNLTMGDLEKLTKGKRTRARPKALRLKEIKVADKVFQRRLPGEDAIRDVKHVWDLVEAVETMSETREELEPLLVTAIGDDFFVVDGHHRLDAYATARFTGWIPVEVFEGALAEARMEALERNVKNKLPLSDEAKAQAAWELVVEEAKRLNGKKPPYGSRAAIIKHTRVKTRTIARMREFARRYGEEVWNKSWRDVARLQWAAELDLASSDGYEDRRKEFEEKRIEQLVKHFLRGPSLIRDPDITARALERVSTDLPIALAKCWTDEALDALLEMTEDLTTEAADEVEQAVERLRAARFEM